MKHIDYIVVGSGLAGIAFCEQLRKANKTFIVFNNDSQQSSGVAAGLYNPVILKRFSKVWKAKELLETYMPKYQDLEQLLNIKLNHPVPVYRKLSSIEEQNQWIVASDKPTLCDFMSDEIVKNINQNINADYGFGKVYHTGRINSALLVTSYNTYLKTEGLLVKKTFQHDLLQIEQNHIKYESVIAKHIVFAEGFGLKMNPFFNHLPLNGTKGEMLTIKAPDLKMDFILKSSVFIVPLGDDMYWVGATYEWEDKTHHITLEARTQLIEKVKAIINCDFQVVDQVAGIRPTTKDRRPFVGRHSNHKNIYVLNGLGTRGVMISPYVAEHLFNHIENSTALNPEIDIKRFDD